MQFLIDEAIDFFAFRNITMTIELHPLLHSKKLIKRANIGFQYFVPEFWMWLIVISREKVASSCESNKHEI